MPWSGGVFTRTNGTYTGAAVWQSDAAAAIKIRADRHDTHDQDLAQGINNTLTKDGQNSPNQNISWGNFKITSLGNGTLAADAVNKGQMDAGDAAANANANTRVLKSGDAMTGPLSVSESLNTSAGYVRVANINNGGSAATGYYFGNDVDASFAAYILKHSTGNSGLGGISSLNIVNTQPAPVTIYTNNLKRIDVRSDGRTDFLGAIQSTADTGIPATAATTTYYVGGFGSPLAGRTVFGDGTGYQYRWAYRTGSAYTDVMVLTDSGVLRPNGLQPGGTGFVVTNFIVTNSAPGALSNGVVWFQY